MRTGWGRASVLAALMLAAKPALAVTLTIATGSLGRDLEVLKSELAQFTTTTGVEVVIVQAGDAPIGQLGQYRRWLNAHSSAVDVYRTEITWAPQLAQHLVDLSEAAKDVAPRHLPALIASQTVAGRLVALPYFTDAPALYYRKDLLERYRLAPPDSLEEMAAAAKTVMDGERAAGNAGMWGYLFQGAAYEGLTSNALEWIAANGGGQMIERDGTISVDNVRSILAVEEAETWVGTITPPEVVTFRDEDTRAIWLAGNAVFARDGFAAYALSEAADSKVRGTFAVMPPLKGPNGWQGAATLGGWSVAVSRYSTHRDEAIALAKFLASAETQKTYEAIALGHLPTIPALYDDADVLAAHPATALWKPILALGVLRPADQTGEAYPRISQAFWEAMQHSLKQDGFSEDYLQSFRYLLEWMQRHGWRRDAPLIPPGAH